MPRGDKVVLRVRAYGQQGLEFALSRATINERIDTSIYVLISALILSSGGLLSSVKWDMIPSTRLWVGLLLLALVVAWIIQATGSVIVEGIVTWLEL